VYFEATPDPSGEGDLPLRSNLNYLSFQPEHPNKRKDSLHIKGNGARGVLSGVYALRGCGLWFWCLG
jgi:hypothetical protein